MICKSCQDTDHHLCPEAARQRDERLTPVEKAASATCDCGHNVRQGQT